MATPIRPLPAGTRRRRLPSTRTILVGARRSGRRQPADLRRPHRRQGPGQPRLARCPRRSNTWSQCPARSSVPRRTSAPTSRTPTPARCSSTTSASPRTTRRSPPAWARSAFRPGPDKEIKVAPARPPLRHDPLLAPGQGRRGRRPRRRRGQVLHLAVHRRLAISSRRKRARWPGSRRGRPRRGRARRATRPWPASSRRWRRPPRRTSSWRRCRPPWRRGPRGPRRPPPGSGWPGRR